MRSQDRNISQYENYNVNKSRIMITAINADITEIDITPIFFGAP